MLIYSLKKNSVKRTMPAYRSWRKDSVAGSSPREMSDKKADNV